MCISVIKENTEAFELKNVKTLYFIFTLLMLHELIIMYLLGVWFLPSMALIALIYMISRKLPATLMRQIAWGTLKETDVWTPFPEMILVRPGDWAFLKHSR